MKQHLQDPSTNCKQAYERKHVGRNSGKHASGSEQMASSARNNDPMILLY
jgi:hypothetical protein